jgi:hypothetical protein
MRNILVAAILVALVPASSIRPPRAVTYYISSSEGSDSNDGLSPQSAWKNLDKIYLKYTFGPGDQILLNRGDVWDGQVRMSARGTAAAPVLLGSYGTGRNPIIYGDSHTLVWVPLREYPGLFRASLGSRSTRAGAYQQATKLTNLPVASSCGGRGCNLLNPTDLTYLTALTPGSWGYSGSTARVMTLDGMPPTTVTVFRSATIEVENSQNLVVQDLDIRRSYTGIDVAGSSNVTNRNNSLQGFSVWESIYAGPTART